MKRNVLFILTVVLSSSLLLTSCGGGEEKVETTPEMTEFVGMLKGSDTDVVKALKKFSDSSEIIENPIGLLSLKEPKIVSVNKDCYEIHAKAGITKRSFEICWKADKIIKITDKGFIH